MKQLVPVKQELHYNEAVNLLVDHFKGWRVRELRNWCSNNRITYATLRSILNNYAGNALPGTVEKVLIAIGYTVEMKKDVTYVIDVRDGISDNKNNQE